MNQQPLILLVEDDENDAYFIERALRELGFAGTLQRMSRTEDAKSFLRAQSAPADSPNLIIADSSVTIRDSGVELLEWLRREKLSADVPFVILSGGLANETRLRAEAAGVRRIVAKGSNYKELLPRLREVLEELPIESRQWLK
jgi:DNA-binding response OmpR family regulator